MIDNVRELGNVTRAGMQYAYCMDLDEFCFIMHSGVVDDYSTRKWKTMQKDYSKWFCYLDYGMADVWMRYVINRWEQKR